jgi:hypothetical protein
MRFLAALAVTGALGCFATGREWTAREDRLLVSNRGFCSYVYRGTRTTPALASAAQPAVVTNQSSDDLLEVAVINASTEGGGIGVRSEGELYDDLAVVAQKLGGTRFVVMKTGMFQNGVSMLVASVLAPRGAPLASEQPPEAKPASAHKCVASELPEWEGASAVEKKALLDRCR